MTRSGFQPFIADTLKIERGQVTYVYGEPGQPAEAEAEVISPS